MLQFAPGEGVEADLLDAAATGCRRHVLQGVHGTCSSCGDAYCEQCLVDLPMHGVTCTGCALEHAGVRRATRPRRSFFRR